VTFRIHASAILKNPYRRKWLFNFTIFSVRPL
jgi:hypothetical protein